MRATHLLGILAVAACGGSAKSDDTLSNSTQQPPGVFTITARGFGPVDGKSVATLSAMRALFAGDEVKPVNVDNTLQFHVFRGGELLLYVVPGEDGTVFNVHATSSKISVSDRAWRAGESFTGAAMLTTCECWGANPTCFKKGEHIGVNFSRSCDGLVHVDARALKVLDGVKVERVIWSPTPFGTEDEPDGDRPDSDPCGGGGGDPCGGD
jgi:hypothetical protein